MKKMILGLVALLCMATVSMNAVMVKCYFNDACISESNMVLTGAQCAELCNQVTQNGFVDSLVARSINFLGRVDNIPNNQLNYQELVIKVGALKYPIHSVIFDLNTGADAVEIDRIKGLLEVEINA